MTVTKPTATQYKEVEMQIEILISDAVVDLGGKPFARTKFKILIGDDGTKLRSAIQEAARKLQRAEQLLNQLSYTDRYR